MVLEDPEMFATYYSLAEAVNGAVAHHLEKMQTQLAAIIQDGTAGGVFHVSDARAAAAAVLDATIAFHHPHFVMQSAGQRREKNLETLLGVLMAGLKAKPDNRHGR